MPKPLRTSAATLRELTPPPGWNDPYACLSCQTWNDNQPHEVCTNCEDVQRILGIEPLPISVISLYRKPSPLRDWLTYYKGRPEEGEPPNQSYRQIVSDILADFFDLHEPKLEAAAKGYDAFVVVPSTNNTPPHPLEGIMQDLQLPKPTLSPLARGAGALGFRRPSAHGYEVTDPDMAGRVLIVDDVYTTGSRINSAAVALRRAGIEVSGAVVIARRVNPGYSPEAQAFWDRQAQQPFTLDQGPHVQGVSK